MALRQEVTDLDDRKEEFLMEMRRAREDFIAKAEQMDKMLRCLNQSYT